MFCAVQIRADGRTDPDTYLPLLLARLHFLDRDGVRRGAEKEKAPAVVAEPNTSGEGDWFVSTSVDCGSSETRLQDCCVKNTFVCTYGVLIKPGDVVRNTFGWSIIKTRMLFLERSVR